MSAMEEEKGQERAKKSFALNLPIPGKKVVSDDIMPVGGGRSSCMKCGQMLSGRWMHVTSVWSWKGIRDEVH